MPDHNITQEMLDALDIVILRARRDAVKQAKDDQELGYFLEADRIVLKLRDEIARLLRRGGVPD